MLSWLLSRGDSAKRLNLNLFQVFQLEPEQLYRIARPM